MLNKKFLITGLATPALFWTITFIAGCSNSNYHHLKNTISELGQIGAPSEKFMRIALLLLAVAATIFSVYFFQSCRRLKISVWPAALSFGLPISILWAGVFPMGNSMHDKQRPLPLLLLLGMIAAIFFWPKQNYRKEKLASIIATLIVLLIFLRFVKPFGNEYEGMIQRFYYLGWSVWYAAIGVLLSKKMKTAKSKSFIG